MAISAESAPEQPGVDCPLCPRLASLRAECRARYPDWFNAPVPAFGDARPSLLIVGLAPGLRGANRTGRPFTGDFAGVLLYETLLRHGFAAGRYGADPADGMTLTGARVVNAVRCVPPDNKPLPAEIRACRRFLAAEFAARPGVRALLALGVIAHEAVLRVHGLALASARFRHGAMHVLPGGLLLADSYHVSRYNTSTRKLTPEMFDAVVAALAARLADADPGAASC